MAFPWAAAGAVLGAGISAFGGAKSQASARKAEQKRIEAQYKQDKKVEKFNWKQTQRQYEFAKKETKVARENQENNITYQEETAKRDYLQQLKIRDFEYGNQVRQYNESERIYGMQRQFNVLAAQQAQEAESRRMNEIVKGMSFQQQDMLVQLLQTQGAAKNRGAKASLANEMSSFGRNQAILAESLVSAKKENRVAMQQIGLDKYEADLGAEANRMLIPLKAPDPMAPLKMPRATILNPLKPKRGPAPMKGTNSVPTNNGLSIANNFLQTGLSLYTTFGGKF